VLKKLATKLSTFYVLATFGSALTIFATIANGNGLTTPRSITQIGQKISVKFGFFNRKILDRSDGCLALSLDGSWNAVDCYLDKPYVCQVPRVPSPTTPKPVITTTIKPTTIRTTSTRKIVTTTKKPGTTCPFGWSYLSGKCYKVINVFTNPLGCYPYSAVEASIHNDEQNQLIGREFLKFN
jgi:hypothetical protein